MNTKIDYNFDSNAFREAFHTEQPLGALWSAEQTHFTLWAPTAQAVVLNLYPDGDDSRPLRSLPMERQDRGVWALALPGNLHGTYYDYLVTAGETTRRTADPYAKACGANGKRSMVVDLRATDPEGWTHDAAPARQTEDIIYEIHVKDFSFDPASGVPADLRGKFAALTLPGTKLAGKDFSTGLDYLKNLGVTHVQLMPSYDYGSVDELGPDSQYNWGYDPVNYNVPEGSYSSDPAQGEVRIREMKEAIAALHKNGFRVIMDVVYNHTYSLDSWLWRTVPGYYYRAWPDGTISNGSGCGNDVASERSMCGKYILDSVLYWTEEYHIDGFRFDLMGLMDVSLMNQIQEALDARYGAGEKLLFGEPWSADKTASQPGTCLADKAGIRKLHPNLGAFCDGTRDAIKGVLTDVRKPGFVNGGPLTAAELEKSLKGWTGEGEPFAFPSQTIQYVSCHDDWTLWDKLIYTMGRDQFDDMEPEILRANKMAAAMYFCCQGHLFFLSGEEFARTKQGEKNSFASSPELNKLDWNRAWENRDLVDYYRGLIALRKQLPGLCDKSPDAGKRFLKVEETAENCVLVLVDNHGDSPWDQLILAFSASKNTERLNLPAGKWEVLADGASSFRWQSPKSCTGSVELAPMSALILGKRNEE